jgi:ubiquinone/menaquinone biosynthesis C-methylase UbiE
MERQFLDFYEHHKIIPVKQTLSDLERHFNRRRSLYLSLGIAPALVNGARVLEVGPGTGDNAVYTTSLKPGLLRFVDGSTESIRCLEDKQANGEFGDVPVEICFADIWNYQDSCKYDLVLCEGLVPGQRNPSNFIKRVSSFCDVGGILVTTNVSKVSVLSEVCRRAVLPVYRTYYCSDKCTSDGLVPKLVTHFTEDLDSLGGVSRNYTDWVWDVIIHPWDDIEFALDDAIIALSDQFEFLGSSPRFYSDWRWYKQLDHCFNNVNESAIDQYRSIEISLLDHRVNPRPYESGIAATVKKLCHEIYNLHQEILMVESISGTDYQNLFSAISDLARLLEDEIPTASRSLNDYLCGMARLLSNSPDNLEPRQFGDFTNFWGRGQQYSSYVAIS